MNVYFWRKLLKNFLNNYILQRVKKSIHWFENAFLDDLSINSKTFLNELCCIFCSVWNASFKYDSSDGYEGFEWEARHRKKEGTENGARKLQAHLNTESNTFIDHFYIINIIVNMFIFNNKNIKVLPSTYFIVIYNL